MDFLTQYSRRMGQNQDNLRERSVAEARSSIRKHFMEDPSAFTVGVLEPDQTQSSKRIRVINESVLKQLNPERVYSKYAVPHPDDHIPSGSIISNLYQLEWLVGATTSLGEIHQQIVLQKLNEVLIFKASDGSTQMIPAVVNGVSRVSDGIEAMNMLIIPDDLVKIRVQSTPLTLGLKRNARVMIGNSMYTITKTDRFTDVDVINIIAREDLAEPGDKDLIDPPTPTPQEGEIVGSNRITRARNYTYTAPFGAPDSWEIDAEQGLISIIEKSGDSITIRAERTVLVEFTLKAIYSDASKKAEPKKIRIISLM